MILFSLGGNYSMAKNKAKMNKFLTGAITATMVATAVAPIASAAAFTDLDRVDESVKAEIDNAVELGFFNDGTKFNPSTKITRGQAALTLARYIAGEQTVKAYAEANKLEDKVTAFKDVPASYKNGADFQQELYYASLIVKNAEAFTQANLNPAGDVTRSQMAKIITETFDLKKAAGYESTITDIDHLDAATKSFIETIASHGVTNVDTFNPAGHVTRSQMASFLVRSYDVVNPSVGAPEITGVSAINAKTAKVTFKNAVPANVDFSNFEIDGGKVVTEAKLSADRKSAEITVNSDFVRNQEYTVTVTGVEDADGKVYADTTGTFTWVVQEGITVALESTTIEQGEVIGLTVKDAAGKDVKDAKVKAVSFNTNILTSNALGDNDGNAEIAPGNVKLTAKNLAGTVDVEVTTVLPDESILTNTFKVTVKEAVVNVSDSGFAFVSGIEDVTTTTNDDNNGLFAYANTAAFNAYATPKTTLVVGEESEFHAFAETNGNPDTSEIDWADEKNPATSVKTSSSIVGTAVLADGVITVSGHAAGKTTLTVTFKDGTKKTFNIEVTAKPVFKDIAIDQTSVKLSDESKGDDDDTGVDGVNLANVEVYTLDQFNKEHALDFAPENSKVTLSSSTDGITVSELDPDGTFTIKAKKDTPVKNATVTVSYFAKDTDAKPTSTKTITVNVTDVDSEVDASDLDILVTSTEIDANAKNVINAVDTIDYSAFEAYLLDSKGNRIGTSQVTEADLVTVADEVTSTDGTIINFADTAEVAQTYLRSANTVTVKVTDGDISKNLEVGYKNSAVVPNAATVSTNAVSVKLLEGVSELTLDELLFGKVDVALDGQLVLDDIEDTEGVAIAVKKNAKNAGYVYNKPLVSVKGTNGNAALPTGASLYGSTTEELENGNLWNNAFVNDVLLKQGFVAEGFDVDFAISNIVSSNETDASVDEETGLVTVSAGESVTYTLVIKGLYIADDVDFETATDAEKAQKNLLDKSVQLNISVAGE